MTTVVYTDGACSGNPGPGGWAWAVPGGKFAAGNAAHTTNQRMEIQAVLEALRTLEGPVNVVSDSTYVINCFRDRWWEGWLKRNWQTSAKKPVANRDLWEPLIELVRSRGDVTFEWVKGHSGNPGNDLVDSLAVEAGKKQQPRSGDGAPQMSTGQNAGGKVLPDGHLVLITGHKPPEIGGYGPNEMADKLLTKIKEVISAKRELNPDLKVVTSLGLGAEQLGAQAAIECFIPVIAVLPFPDQESVWPPQSKLSYSELLTKVETEILLQATAPTSKQAAGGSLGRKNAWLADNVDEAIVIWNGEDAQLERFVHTLQEKLTEDNVWIVTP